MTGNAANLRLLVLAGRGFMRGYAGTHYLLNALHERGVRLDVIAWDEAANRHLYASLPYPVQVHTPGRLPGMGRKVNEGLRHWADPRLWAYLRRYRQCDAILVCEGEFSATVMVGRKLFPRKPLFHFCQELDIGSQHYYWKSYRAFTQLADGFLDVEPHRAAIRAHLLQARKPYWILPNTLPLAEVQAGGDTQLLTEFLAHRAGRPLVISAGSVNDSDKPFGRLLEIVGRAQRALVFVGIFSNVDARQLAAMRQEAGVRLAHVPHVLLGPQARSAVIACLAQADVGLIDYAYATCPTENQRYCAPTKFYEYMAKGLAIVTSDNPSLRDIIEKEQIGFCAADDEAVSFARALDRAVADPDALARMKLRAGRAFAAHYCYEMLCEPVVSAFVEKMVYLAGADRPSGRSKGVLDE